MRRRGTRRIICCLDEHHAYPPIDLVFNLNQDGAKGDYNTYVQNWQQDMKEAYQIAQQNAKKTAEADLPFENCRCHF